MGDVIAMEDVSPGNPMSLLDGVLSRKTLMAFWTVKRSVKIRS
jgi:hypothetical protein